MDPLLNSSPEDPTFEQELQGSHDQDSLLARWCLEGRPRVTAALAEDGGIVRGAALLLGSSNEPAKLWFVDAESVEALALKAAFEFRVGRTESARTRFRALAKGAKTSAWRRRAYAALAWGLVANKEYECAVRSALVVGMEDVEEEDRFGLLVVSARIKVEIGDVAGARRDFVRAETEFAKYAKVKGDARMALTEARIFFAEGDITNAAAKWHRQCVISTARSVFPPTPVESAASSLTAFAVGAVIGDLGDFIIEGSRWARHESANNFAVCALNIGRLDDAVAALEDVMKSFGYPTVVDGVAAGNLKTLYELCRTPDAQRLIGKS